MASNTQYYNLLPIVLVLLLLICDSAALKFLKKTQDTAQANINHEELTTLIRVAPEEHDATIRHALQILSSIQESPSCNRLATSTLLDSCRSIDGSKREIESEIEDVRSIYAAQLAMCEIASAHSPVPHSCKELAPPSDAKPHHNGGSLRLRKGELAGCLQALESRPQWWTSYSNSRQNAVVMCQAARVDIDKDDLIKLHQKLVETQLEANTALAETAKVSHQNSLKLQKDFVLAKEAFQDQLVRDLESSSVRMHSYFDKLMSSLNAAFQATLSNLRSATTAVESDMASLNKNMNAASAASADLEKNVGRVFQRVVEGSAELAKVQTTQWDASRGVATELQVSLNNLQKGDLGALIKTLSEMGLQLDNSNRIIAQIYDRQIDIEERIGYLSQSFTQLETKAVSLSAAQTRQAETHSKLHEKMEVDMQVAQGYLSDVTSTAMQLQATVAETYSKVESMTAFARIFGNFFDWAIMAGVGLLLLFAAGFMAFVWKYSPKLIFAIFAMTTFIVVDLSGALTQVDVRFAALVAFARYIHCDSFVRASVIFAIFLLASLTCYSPGRRKRVNDATKAAFSDLPFTRATASRF